MEMKLWHESQLARNLQTHIREKLLVWREKNDPGPWYEWGWWDSQIELHILTNFKRTAIKALEKR